MRKITISKHNFEVLFHYYSVNEWNQVDDSDPAVFDTERGEVLFPFGGLDDEISPQRKASIARWINTSGAKRRNPARYVEVPHIYHRDEHVLMNEFLRTLPKNRTIETFDAGRPIGIGGTIEQFTDKERNEWEDYKWRHILTEIKEWIDELGKERKIEFSYPDDIT